MRASASQSDDDDVSTAESAATTKTKTKTKTTAATTTSGEGAKAVHDYEAARAVDGGGASAIRRRAQDARQGVEEDRGVRRDEDGGADTIARAKVLREVAEGAEEYGRGRSAVGRDEREEQRQRRRRVHRDEHGEHDDDNDERNDDGEHEQQQHRWRKATTGTTKQQGSKIVENGALGE